MASIKKAAKVLNELSRGTSRKHMYQAWCQWMLPDEQQGFYFDEVYNYITKSKGGKKSDRA